MGALFCVLMRLLTILRWYNDISSTLHSKILPLKCYDAILGMDWLAQHSPMQVQWAHQWMSFCHQGKNVKIQGLGDVSGRCLQVSEEQLHAMYKNEDIWCEVQLYYVDNTE